MIKRGDDNIEKVKLSFGDIIKYSGSIVSAIAVIAAVILWVQSQGVDKYYPKISGENLEKQFSKFDQQMTEVQKQNVEIIRILGRIEGIENK